VNALLLINVGQDLLFSDKKLPSGSYIICMCPNRAWMNRSFLAADLRGLTRIFLLFHPCAKPVCFCVQLCRGFTRIYADQNTFIFIFISVVLMRHGVAQIDMDEHEYWQMFFLYFGLGIWR
jgi:hypothetical protein